MLCHVVRLALLSMRARITLAAQQLHLCYHSCACPLLHTAPHCLHRVDKAADMHAPSWCTTLGEVRDVLRIPSFLVIVLQVNRG